MKQVKENLQRRAVATPGDRNEETSLDCDCDLNDNDVAARLNCRRKKIQAQIKCDKRIESRNKFVSLREFKGFILRLIGIPYIGLVLFKTWLDKNNKLGWTLLPKCASTSMRVIQLVKSGFYTGRENFLNHKAKEMWPVIPEKHHVHKIEPRNPDF